MISSKLALAAIFSLSLTQSTYGRNLRKTQWSTVSTPINRVAPEITKYDKELIPVNLDVESKDEKYSLSSEGDEENRDMQSVTTIRIKNECSADVYILIWDGANGVHGTLPAGYTYDFETPTNGFHIYAQSGSYELSGGSRCYDNGNKCTREEVISSNDLGGTIDFPITCAESPSTTPPTSTTTTTTGTTSSGNTGSNSQSGNDNEWLIQHNIRRQKYHAQYNTNYVPLVWSDLLTQKAQEYANELIAKDDCTIEHAICNAFEYGGENLAATKGTNAAAPSEDSVLTRWAEEEEFVGHPSNGHWTQVIWRATTEVGCAVANKPMNGDLHCHIQVCRYMTPGNCNINGTNWEEKMLEDNSYCSANRPGSWCIQEGY